MNLIVLVRLLLVVIVVIGIDIIFKINKTIKVDRRISRYSIDSIVENDDSISDAIKNKYNHFLRRNRGRVKKIRVLDRQSNKYNKYVTVGDRIDLIDFIILKLLIGIIFVVVVVISSAAKGHIVGLIGLIFSFIFGYYIYDIYLYFSTKYKKNKIKNDILRAVILMNNAFKAGKSVMQAVEIASIELPRPINLEFERIYQDLSFGISSDVAFSRFARRVDLEEARYIASSLIILNKTGGNIVNVFSSIERTLFDKKKLEEDLKNSTQASNLIVKVLMAVPVVFVVIIYGLSPSYFEPLFSSVLGYMVILILIVMFSIYLYLLNKIMKVRV